MNTRTVLSLLLVGCTTVVAAAPPSSGNDLTRVAATPAAEAVKTFQVHKGLRVELVACEPMIESPVGICFDEDGRLFVVEMRGYPDRREENLGRIKLLEDTTRSGRYDKATIFADHLPWPTSVIASNGGVFVTASPDILWLKDTRHTGTADERNVAFTGFAANVDRLNVQGLVNGLTWGVDGRIHVATSFNGGQVFRPGGHDKPLDLRGKDFVFDPGSLTTSTENGGGQHGLSYDSFGRKFVCMNAKAVQTFLYDGRYAARNPFYPMPVALADVVADGSDVFRISAGEPWRELRTKWRVAGKASGPVEGGGRASGYFTGVSGITLYTGDALPPEFRDNAFIGEVANNLVHREVIHPDGVTVVARRATDESKAEFLASTDTWFRPVQMAVGPDGALYVVDMYREVIEHPWSLPDDIKGKLDLHSGTERGRIWRVVPEGFVPRRPPHLSTATTAELVALLEHPNGWHRTTASRLLYERRDPAAVPLLTKLLWGSPSPVGRWHALAALAAQDSLEEAHVLGAMRDAEPHVRERAILLSESLFRSAPPSKELRAEFLDLVNDRAIAVRYQLAFTLGELQPAQRLASLSLLALHDGADAHMRPALLTSVAGNEVAIFGAISTAGVSETDSGNRQFLEQLASLIGRRGVESDAVAVVAAIQSRVYEKDLAAIFSLARALREGAGRSLGATNAAAVEMPEVIDRARAAAVDDATPEAIRIEAIGLLGTTRFADAAAALLPLLDARRAQAIQLAALTALDQFTDAKVAPAILERLATFGPRVRGTALAALLKRPERATALLDAIQAGALRPADLSSAQAGFLRRHPDAHVRTLAGKLLAAGGGSRDAVVAAFQPALELRGNADRGHELYQQCCSSCHRLGSEGFAVGPDLTTIRAAGKGKALTNLVDPNREVAPNYVAYLVETRSGESLIGVVDETAASVIVRQPFGKDTTVPRSDLKRMESQKLSLMPEGLEEGLSAQDLADLLEYVFTAK